jgi:exopolyphosphatase / guanosine-5'-triphosphate,3'-diphosphate pyrophosphatase
VNPIPETYAAVDLGSNSFHMIVANAIDGRLQVIDRIKDMVRLAGGLDDKQRLTQEAMDRALECLSRFGQRIREIPRRNVRAVGTNTLRQAQNSTVFLKQANLALGHPIEIISGREEARLIFLGVAHCIYHETERRLVVDIGGGSTEIAIGRGYYAQLTDSLYTGCVSMSRRCFGDGEITAKKFRKAVLFARQELESIESLYKRTGWDSVYGSSGTVLAIHDVIRALGWSESHITPTALAHLKEALIDAGHTDKLDFDNLPETRKPVFPGGLAILCAIFEALEIENMTASDGALREGLLHDLIGRLQDQDTREKTINDITKRYNVDTEHAGRIEFTCTDIFRQLENDWGLDRDYDLKFLKWAAKLHEIGLFIAHYQYHKHGAYLLNHSDLPGFSREEQARLAFLVRGHRRKFPLEELQLLPEESRQKLLRLCVILRLAVVMHRSRAYAALPQFTLAAGDNAIRMKFPAGWLDSHPLTQADLQVETDLLADTHMELSFQ